MDDPIVDSDRSDATRRGALKILLWGIPLLAIALLCLALGIPWWGVAIGIGLFVLIIVFEA